jgi:cytochrome c oxidase cbb3-type subunit III
MRLGLQRAVLITVGVAVLAALFQWAHISVLESRLMRSDPGAAPETPKLFHFAIQRGVAIFHDRCASCHGADGRGDRSRGIPDLGDADWLYGTGTVGDIEKVVYYGIRSHNPRGWNLAVMPAFARPVPSPTEHIPPLTPPAIRALTEYLLSREGQPADRTAAMEGAAIYGSSGGCYDCHTADAKGDSAIGAPNLTDSIWLYGDGSRQSIYDSIAYGRQGVCPARAGLLRPVQIREVSLYTFSLSHSSTTH